MSISDTSQAKRYASIAEVAAAQCQQFTEEARKAPEYTDLAKQYAENAEGSATAAQASRDQAAQSANGASSSASAAQSYANSASSSSQSASSSATQAESSAESAANSAQSASEDAQTASDAVTKTLRVSDSDISPLAAAADRANKVLSCDASGNFQFTAPASGSAQDVLNQLAEPTGAELVADGDQTVSQSLSVKFNGLSFAAGGVANSTKDLFYYATDKYWYYWNGSFPKTVASGSSPSSTGGVSSSAWLPMSDAVLKALLLSSSGSENVNRPSETVEAALLRNDGYFTDIISLDNRTSIPSESYGGYKHWVPIKQDGFQLAQYTFKTPTKVDAKFMADPINASSGPIFNMGRNDLDQRSAFFSQDAYSVKDVMLFNGTAQLVKFQPWTSHMSTVENNRIVEPSTSGECIVNFMDQNFWPHVLFNVLSESNDQATNLVKAIDDQGNSIDRFTGNSRLFVFGNRCTWAGLAPGGYMSYTSAVAARIKDNSAQNASSAVIFGYPSTFSTVDSLYCEMNFGNQCAAQIGDAGVTDQQVISDILIKDVYANLHGKTTNYIAKSGNSLVIFNGVELDRIFVSNIPSQPQPVVALPDIPYHKIIAGRINADSMPLIPLTTNHVVVVDKYGCNIPALNGDLIWSENSTAIPANTSTAVAPGWFAKSTAATTFSKVGNNNPVASLRQSRNVGSLPVSAGGTGTIVFEHTRAERLDGRNVTIQLLVNATAVQNGILSIKVLNDDGSSSSLFSGSVTVGGGWREITKTVAVSGATRSNSFIAVSMSITPVSADTLLVTGHRLNDGSFGLSGDADYYSFAEVNRLKADFSYITP